MGAFDFERVELKLFGRDRAGVDGEDGKRERSFGERGFARDGPGGARAVIFGGGAGDFRLDEGTGVDELQNVFLIRFGDRLLDLSGYGERCGEDDHRG